MLGPSVSCILPVRDGAAWLGEAIESVLLQTEPPDEILVVDDGSRDDSAAIARHFGARVRVVCQGGAGPAGARNRGVALASGELVAFLDQDDLWRPSKLACQLARFRTRPGLELCLCHVRRFWQDGRPRATRGPRMGSVPGFATPAWLARREVFKRFGPLDTSLRFADASDWFLRAAARGLVWEMLPNTLVMHRMHDSNLSRHRRDSSFEFLDLVKRHLDGRRTAPQSSK